MTVYRRDRVPGLVDPKVISASYEATVLSSSPLAFWPVSEPSGSTMLDASGAGRNGTYTSVTLGQPSIIPTSTATCGEFGSGSVGTVADAAWMDVDSITIECVLVVSDASAARVPVSRDNGSTRLWRFYVFTNRQVWADVWEESGTNRTVNSTDTLDLDTPYHVAITAEAGVAVQLWINGVSQDSIAMPGNARKGTLPIRLGAGSTFHMDGLLQCVAFYDRALPGAELLAHAQAAGLA